MVSPRTVQFPLRQEALNPIFPATLETSLSSPREIQTTGPPTSPSNSTPSLRAVRAPSSRATQISLYSPIVAQIPISPTAQAIPLSPPRVMRSSISAASPSNPIPSPRAAQISTSPTAPAAPLASPRTTQAPVPQPAAPAQNSRRWQYFIPKKERNCGSWLWRKSRTRCWRHHNLERFPWFFAYRLCFAFVMCFWTMCFLCFVSCSCILIGRWIEQNQGIHTLINIQARKSESH